MMAMGGGPPEGASLHGGISEEGENELRGARSFETAMGKVAMIESGDGEHADEVEHDGGNHGERAPADHEDKEAGEVQKNVGNRAAEIEAVTFCDGRVVLGLIVRVPPLAEHDGELF